MFVKHCCSDYFRNWKIFSYQQSIWEITKNSPVQKLKKKQVGLTEHVSETESLSFDSALFITRKSLNSAEDAIFQSYNSALLQGYFSANFLWKSADSERNSANSLWNSTELRWFLRDSERQYYFFLFFSKIFRSSSISRHIFLIFSPICEKKFSFSIFFWATDITNTKVWVVVTAQVTKVVGSKFPV